jgi:ribonucleotide reductase beta subunit family protein with ferritin-like domain
MSIFDKRVAFKPFEYPDIIPYKDAINHSYWLVSEWNFISDIHDFNVKLGDVEKNAIKNALLAISQIEVSVKKFWTKLGDRFPKAEFEQVGVTLGENEVRHADAYSHLLQVLNLNDDFSLLLQNPVIQGRVDYLTKYLKGASENSNENFTLTLTLFSIFIENVSLFSQFLVIKSFNKYLNILKDIDNVVQATQKEECYVEKTEVLTPDGWKQLAQMNIGDEAIQYNHGNLEIVKVKHVTKKKYTGEVYHFHKNKNQCMVTPDHDMVFYNTKNELKKVKAKDFIPESKKKLPHGGLFCNKGLDDLSFEDRLRIAIQADGSVLEWTNVKNGGYNYSIGLTKQRKIDRLEWILSKLNLEYNKEYLDDKIEYKIKYDLEHDYKEFDWVEIRDKSVKWCQEFVKECIEWDGYKTRCKDSFDYSSTNKRAIDKVQLVAILAGYRTSIRFKEKCYKLSLLNKDLITHCHALEKDVVNYDGYVYCITVPSGVIITRYKDDIMIAGNCLHAMLGVCIIKHVQEEFPEWFNDDFYQKLYRACRKAYDAESKIIDWIFEAGELPFLPKDVVKEFTKHRFNESMEMIGGSKVFEVDVDKLSLVQWFNDEIYGELNTDFFHKKPVSYSKKTKSITAEDLF